MLVNDYVRLPKRTPENTPFMIRSDLRDRLGLNRDFPDYWVVNPFDGRITNVENMIIWVFVLWGFLRFFDLSRLIFITHK